MEENKEMQRDEIEKQLQQDEDKRFLLDATKYRHRIELLAAYGFNVSQAIEFMKLLVLDDIRYTLWADGEPTISETFSNLYELMEEFRVGYRDGAALRVTGTVETV